MKSNQEHLGGSYFSPDPVLVTIGLVISLFAALYQFLTSTGNQADRKSRKKYRLFKAKKAEDRLKIHEDHQYGQKKVVKIAGCIYVPIGYGVSNCALLEGHDACVLVNALESEEEAIEALAAFRHLTDKPIRGIILTSFDINHIAGVRVFVNAFANVTVYVQQTFGTKSFFSECRAMKERWLKMNGLFLESTHGNGLGKTHLKRLPWPEQFQFTDLKLKRVTKGGMDLDLPGLSLNLKPCCGQSGDHLVVWWEEKRALFCGKNVYSTMPNIYGLDGGLPRDVKKQISALDQMLAFKADILVPTYTRPSASKEEARQFLTSQRDCLQFLHDQTVRLMNKGLYPNEIVEVIDPPLSLEYSPFLREFHGSIDHVVKGIFSYYMGWFSGDAQDLHPITPSEEAMRIMDLCAGKERLLEGIQQSIDTDQFQWALKMCDWLLLASDRDTIDSVKELRVKVLRSLAKHVPSALSRNWFNSEADLLETSKNESKESRTMVPRLENCDLGNTLKFMQVAIDPEMAGDTQLSVHCIVDGVEKHIKIRNGVLVACDSVEGEVDLKLVLSLEVLKSLLRLERKDGKLGQFLDQVSIEFIPRKTKLLATLLQCFQAEAFY